MAEQQGWLNAIMEILGSSAEAMHYTEIADEIIGRQLRTAVGATPANTVNAYISNSLRDEGADSPFDRTARGYYRLKSHEFNVPPSSLGNDSHISPEAPVTPSEEAKEATGLINALGMHWSREKVYWSSSSPKQATYRRQTQQ